MVIVHIIRNFRIVPSPKTEVSQFFMPVQLHVYPSRKKRVVVSMVIMGSSCDNLSICLMIHSDELQIPLTLNDTGFVFPKNGVWVRLDKL
jgi:hypothetical protein